MRNLFVFHQNLVINTDKKDDVINSQNTLQVAAIDKESGDATFTTVVIEVLSEGQSSKNTHSDAHIRYWLLKSLQTETLCLSVYTAVPHGPLGDERLTGCTVGKALFLSVVFMTVLGCILTMGMWLKKKHKGKRDPLERGCVAQGKHPNVVRSFMAIM